MTFKKGKNDRDIKICKNCHKEYFEKENFNWSCRTHHYQFNGEFYWCCGKRGEDQIGCKVSKHECKDDEDEEDAEEKKKDKERQLKYMKCMCCKELGHSIENCDRDPNLKTSANTALDDIRIMEIQDNRTLFAETVIMTSHLLKKCARVQKIYENELDTPMGKLQEQINLNAFKRGAMFFEDYNYEPYNRHILIDPNKVSDDEDEYLFSDIMKSNAKDQESDPDKPGKMVGFSAPPGGLKKGDDDNEEKKSVKLTEAMLDSHIKEDYQHDGLTVQTESEKQE